MGLSPQQISELHDLMWELHAGAASPDDRARLERMVCEDPEVRAFYVRYMHLCADLHWSLAGTADNGASNMPGAAEETTIPTTAPGIPLSSPFPLDVTQPFGVVSSPPASFPTFAFSYLVAAVVLGTAMLLGWAWKMAEYSQVARRATREGKSRDVVPPVEATQWVGRVTGLFDCRWADPKTEAFGGAGVFVGRKYALASGLMEITYDTGAKVILEGPCTYEVESKTSGYLTIGRVTARIGERGEGREERDKIVAKHLSSVGKDGASSSLPPLLSPLFYVRTPTAIVTDLGTEFGVEYDKSGVTRSLVFRGSVTLRAILADGKTQGSAQVLRENEFARVERTGANHSGDPAIVLEASAKLPTFVRKMPKQTIKVFDLVDVVAGGDGFSGRRDGGINPSDGSMLHGASMTDYYKENPNKDQFRGDGRYHRVEGQPFIDGVFIPDGKQGPMQVDSAGHRFDGFPPTTNTASGWIHGGGVIPCLTEGRVVGVLSCVLDNVDYSSPGHGVLFIHANKGITFDLDAIRAANHNCRIVAFRAVAGIAPEGGVADLWVLVDGQKQFVQRQAHSTSRPMTVSIPIRSGNRFLTLAATDGDSNVTADFTMFGNPRLELISDDSGERKEDHER
jgi:hypothetical protein